MKSKFSLLFLAFICLFSFFLPSCEPETIVETEFITVNDTIIVNTTDTLFVPVGPEVTTFFLTRHAETTEVGTNPLLSQEGIERAERLRDMFSQLELDRVYSTNFNRTQLTALPTSEDQEIAITGYGGFDQDEVIDDILDDVGEGKILIVGHGNTTPLFLNVLTGTSDYADLPEDAYDNFYIVSTRSKGDSEVIHLKY